MRDDDHFGGWIAAITRNHIADLYRGQSSAEAAEEEGDAAVPEHSTAHSEARAVLAAIQALPAAYRETLTCRLVEGMTGPEIAQRTGLKHESVRVNLHRGMKLLRERIDASSHHGRRGGGSDE